MKRVRYYLFVIRWLWRNREWSSNRQKYKAMDRDYQTLINRRKKG